MAAKKVLGIILMCVGPILLITSFAIAKFAFNYSFLSTSNSISSGDPNYTEISLLINLFWLGILGTPILGLAGLFLFNSKK
jgi:hypothetical protein